MDSKAPVEYYRISEIARINFKNAIEAQEKVQLFIEFSGALSEALSGFFKTKCLTKDGEPTHSAATQFEASSKIQSSYSTFPFDSTLKSNS